MYGTVTFAFDRGWKGIHHTTAAECTKGRPLRNAGRPGDDSAVRLPDGIILVGGLWPSIDRRSRYFGHGPALLPQPSRNPDCVYSEVLPPRRFISIPVCLTMMQPAERDREFVAGLQADSSRLRKAQVMGIGRRASANKARLAADEPEVVLVAQTLRLADGKNTLVDLGIGNTARPVRTRGLSAR